jgi:uncharacterized protein (TIGR03435 family)
MNADRSFVLPVSLLVSILLAALLSLTLGVQTLPAQSQTVPQWQIDAGGKMQFEVSSVKQDKSGLPPSGATPYANVAMGPGDIYAPTGGFFTATNLPLFTYIAFAYKASGNQIKNLQAQVPKWVLNDRYDMQGRMQGSPSKDQMRVMVQALLADRFKLSVHHENRQLPAFALVPIQAGKTGPQLVAHPSDASCSSFYASSPATPGGGTPAAQAQETVAGGFPATCGGIQPMEASDSGRVRMGARNVSLALLANSMTGWPSGLDRPVLDRTELNGLFDFTLEWTPQLNGPVSPGATFQPDADGPTFLEALKDQLGLKLASQTGPVDVLVLDHIEEPSPN